MAPSMEDEEGRECLVEVEELRECSVEDEQVASTEEKSEEDELQEEEIKRNLFNWAMNSRWEDVMKKYQEVSMAHKVKITRRGDTALHIAVLEGKEYVVEKLVEHIDKKNRKSEHGEGKGSEETPKDHPLKVQNEKGNTPLHMAALIGNVFMCQCIAQNHPDLVGVRNIEGETPLFLAALHGKKDAFLCLHNMYSLNNNRADDSSFWRNKKGENILHCAIAGEYFDLAYQIMCKYKSLIIYGQNEQGLTPLHLLASKPAAFKSASYMGRFNRIIYHYLEESNPPVERLKLRPKDKREYANEKYPVNYDTCINFFNVLKETIIPGRGKLKSTVDQDISNGREATTKNQATEENLSLETCGNFFRDLWNRITKMPETCRKNITKCENCLETKRPDPENPQGDEKQLLPPNYNTGFKLVKFIYTAMLVVLGLGSKEIRKIHAKKEKHQWAVQVLNKLLESAPKEYDNTAGSRPQTKVGDTDAYSSVANVEKMAAVDDEHNNNLKEGKDQKADGEENNVKKGETVKIDRKETPMLIAAKNGIQEMVEKILLLFPVAIYDMNSENKNVVLLAAENRQPHVYKLLLMKETLKDSIFHEVDNKGNSALHLAAKSTSHQPWLIPGAALQLQWEIKWYEYVENSMPVNFFVRYNKENKTAREIFTEEHKDLVKNGSEWLNDTSNSCSVVAALIATVAFATAATVPGGVNDENGVPVLEDRWAFKIFSVSSVIALSFSVTSLVMFLAILTSRHEENDFGSALPTKLLLGLLSLFISIAAILISFCAGHFFVLSDEFKYAAFHIYFVTCLPVVYFGIMQFPLYLDLLWASFATVPRRSCKADS